MYVIFAALTVQVLEINILFSFGGRMAHISKDGTMDTVNRNHSQPITNSPIAQAHIDYWGQVHGCNVCGQDTPSVNQM